MHTRPDGVTQTYSRAAGSAVPCKHGPTLSYTHICSEPMASREAGSRLQLQLTHTNPTHTDPRRQSPSERHTHAHRRATVGGIWRGWVHRLMRTRTHIYTQSGVKQGLQEQPRANKQEENSLITSGCAGGREGGRESRPGEGVIFHTGPAMSALPVRVLEAGVQACAALSSTHL